MLRYAILGTGAVGGYYGGKLAKAGADVRFLARSDAHYVRQNGLKIDSPAGSFHLDQVSVATDPAELGPVDVVIVAWKATSNNHLATALPPLVDHNTTVFVLQNGLNVEQDALDHMKSGQLLGGCCFLCSNKVGPGHIKHLDYGRIHFGEYRPTKNPDRITSFGLRDVDNLERQLAIAHDLEMAGIENKLVGDLAKTRWQKLMWNIPFNGLSVVLDADTSEIMANTHSRSLAERLMKEVQHAAKACGIEVSDEFQQKMMHDTDKMVPYASSMLLDYRNKRPMEIDAIFGNVVQAGLEAGFTPLLIQSLTDQLKFINSRNLSA